MDKSLCQVCFSKCKHIETLIKQDNVIYYGTIIRCETCKKDLVALLHEIAAYENQPDRFKYIENYMHKNYKIY